MNIKTKFRLGLVALVVLSTLSVATDAFWPELLPGALLDYTNSPEYESYFTTGVMLAALAGLLAFVVSLVGMFMFWNPSRHLFAASVLIGFSISPFMGPEVVSSLASTFYGLLDLANGALLAIVYLSPVSSLFKTGT